ncbi:histidine phosphatase family protein [Raineyella fluvialis]|uniref:Histidine phosphatase family protein n=1 Tax=Raineyella fluvialis TaxID=2662261 RepID=A0A5Q2FC03_9ACTN|nr:histidine phosphatase family protein [Raineyella fluvialis]QGF24309.1 histidine phosphatase family protein [Raineyella fluvialis]
MSDPTDTPPLSAGRLRAPERLVLVRHGESVGNVADRRAGAAGLGQLDLATRDPDTPLSDNGRAQAEALGAYFAALPRAERPDAVLSSPYLRARTTAEICLAAAGMTELLAVDERLRERDLGSWEGYTHKGITEKFPEEAARRARTGKFYYRPPGGESWTDVALRVRSVLGDIRAEYHDANVWVFSHQAVIMSFRLVIEGLQEASLLEIDSTVPLPNCSLTTYVREEGGTLELESYADSGPIERSPATSTREPAAGMAPG